MRETRSRIARSQSLRRLALALPLLPWLAGCGHFGEGFFYYPPQVRGNKVDPDSVAQLVPGTSTRKDVTALLGSPTAKASFDDNTWIYISEVTTPVIAGTQDVRDQQVYEISFDPKGVLTKINRRTQKDSLPVAVVSRTTPSPGTEASFMQQLLGNIGRFGVAPQLNNNEGAPGTATNPGNF